MKLVKFCIKNCGECPHLAYVFEEYENRYMYYCNFLYKYIDNEIDIRHKIADICVLEDC